VSTLSPAAVWRITPELTSALDERLGPPIDGYVNGTQVWLTPDGPGETMLEWRLHPVAGYQPPAGVAADELWEAVIDALSSGASPDALAIGGERRGLTTFWDGLECFPAYAEESEPAAVTAAAREALGIAPDRAGLVDHERIGKEWERSRGRSSLVAMLLAELETAQ
jgi:hypothetical protein